MQCFFVTSAVGRLCTSGVERMCTSFWVAPEVDFRQSANVRRKSASHEIRALQLRSHPESGLVRYDDGCGIDAQVLGAGRDGHWGLAGMRERATRIGGELKISSSATTGTEIQLSIPGNIAFQLSPAEPGLRLAQSG
jgi:signal transduction histidine kinase